jgi:hypothetical protein
MIISTNVAAMQQLRSSVRANNALITDTLTNHSYAQVTFFSD